MEWRACGRGVRDHFLERSNRHVPDVGVDRHLPLGGHLEDTEDLVIRRPRVVLMRQADAQAAGLEILQQQCLYFTVSCRIDRFIPGLAQQCEELLQLAFFIDTAAANLGERIGVFGHRADAQLLVRGRRPEVQERRTTAALQERGYVAHPSLEFQRCGNTVVSLEDVGLVRLAVRVQVDEARRYDQTCNIDGLGAGKRLLGNDRDAVAADAHVANSVETRLGVHHRAANQYDVVGLLRRRGGGARQRCRRREHERDRGQKRKSGHGETPHGQSEQLPGH